MADRENVVPELLERWRDGDRYALDELIPIVERELRSLARSYLHGERSDHTLQTSALVNEAYVRLVEQPGLGGDNRGQFVAMAARVMRQILVDHARRTRSQKRGGQVMRVTFDEAKETGAPGAPDLTDALAVHEAMRRLEALSPVQSQIVELRVFGGLTNREIASVVEVSLATVNRHWKMARAWLYRELGQESPTP